MRKSTRYYVARDDNGKVMTLARIVETDTELWGEFLRDGRWMENATVLDLRADPTYGEEISEAAAARIAADFGGSL